MHFKTISLVNTLQKDSSYDRAVSLFFYMARKVIKLTGFNCAVMKTIIDFSNKIISNLKNRELINESTVQKSENEISIIRKTRDAKVLLNTTRGLLKRTQQKIDKLPTKTETKEQRDLEDKLIAAEENYILNEEQYDLTLRALKKAF